MKNIFSILFVLLFISGCSHVFSESTQDELFLEQEEKIETLEQEIKDLKDQLKETQPQELIYTTDLNSWTSSDILRALGKQDATYKNQTFEEFIYNEDGTFYYYESDFFPKDQFHKLTYKKRGYEIRSGHFRIFDLSERAVRTPEESFKVYRDYLTRESTLDQDITCIEESKCGNEVTLITCTRDKDYLYVWNKDKFLFTATNDYGRAFETFKKTFCEQTSITQITGLFFLGLKNRIK
jgi:hypothetical protein